MHIRRGITQKNKFINYSVVKGASPAFMIKKLFFAQQNERKESYTRAPGMIRNHAWIINVSHHSGEAERKNFQNFVIILRFMLRSTAKEASVRIHNDLDSLCCRVSQRSNKSEVISRAAEKLLITRGSVARRKVFCFCFATKNHRESVSLSFNLSKFFPLAVL